MQNIDDFIRENTVNHPRVTDTIALREIRNIGQNRLLKSYSDMLMEKTEREILWFANKLSKLINGSLRNFSNTDVFLLRELIQPAKWYTLVTEELPPPTRHTPRLTLSSLMTTWSLAHKKLHDLVMENGYDKLSRDFGVPKYFLTNLFSYRIQKLPDGNGRRVLKSLPNYHVIRAFRQVVNPDLWYIYPEELEEN